MIDTPIKTRLNGATSEGVIVALVNEYLSSRPLTELARLPEGCAPGRIANSEDINYWAVKLARASLDFRGTPPVFAMLQELTTLFGDASARLAKIGHWRKEGV